MSTYVKRKCGNCSGTIENWTRDYRTIGTPLMKCENCGALNKVDHITEWDLMSKFEKMSWIFGILSAFYYTLFTVLLFALVAYLLSLEMGTISIVSAIILGLSLRYSLLYFAIRESRKRMHDSHYRMMLRDSDVFEIVDFYKKAQPIFLYEGDLDGIGRLVHPNGKVKYEGTMKNGKKHGGGKEYTEDGNFVYVGQFNDDLYHGYGKLYDEQGEVVYSGEFKFGFMSQ